MKFEDSAYFDILKHHKVEKTYGRFYFFETFIIGEMYEGVHFDLEKINVFIDDILEYYQNNTTQDPSKLIYISNRINSYSLDPNSWPDIEVNYGFNYIRIIVAYTSWATTNVLIEKEFSKADIKHAPSLDDAIKWCLNFKNKP